MVSLSPAEKAWLTENPHIRLATLTNQPPFSMMDADGNHTGILADILERLSAAIGQKIAPELVGHAASDTHDVAKQDGIYGSASIFKTSRHANAYLLTDAFMTTPFYIYTKTENHSDIRRPADLNGKRVAVPRNHRAAAAYLAGIGNVRTIPADNPLEQMQKVVSGEADALIGYFTYPYLVNKYLMVDLVMAFIAKSDQGLHIGVNPEHAVLQGILNKAIATLDESTTNAITAKWTAISKEETHGLELTSEEQAWLAEHPDLTFGFTTSFEPFLIRGANGQHTGILVDLLRELNAQLGTQFALEVDSWPVILEKVKNKELGAVLAVASHTADAMGLLKTIPYTTVYPAFFAREDAPFDIKRLDDIRGKSIAILDQAKVMESVLEPFGPDVNILRYPDNRTPFQMVFDGKADLAFGLSIHAYYINKLGLIGVKPVHTLLERPSNVGMAVRTDWPELVSILNKWLTRFSKQEIDTIIGRWIDSPVREKSIDLTGEEKDWLAQNRTAKVRITDYPPYMIAKGNEPPHGIVIDYLKLIEERTGIRFTYERSSQPFAEFLESMKQRQGPDMTAMIVPTREREQFLSFTQTYLSSPYVIFIREKDELILDISALVDKTVAVPQGFVVHGQLARDYPQIRLALFDSDEAALQALATGQADAYIGNLTVASHIIHQRGFSGLQVAASTPFGDQNLAMGIRNDRSELASIVDKALASITADEKNAIRTKYLAIEYEPGIDKAKVLRWVLLIGGGASGLVLVFIFWNLQLRKETNLRKESEAQLRAFLERMPIAACLVDKHENMYYHNRRFIELFGYEHDDIKTLAAWWPKAYPDKHYRQWVIETWSACVRRSEEHGTDIEAKEYKVTCKSGEVREMEISGIVLGDRYLATLIDNTERNRTEEQLVKAKEVAEAANHSKSLFLANMSHELRTPLNAILGFSGMLAREENTTADQQEKLAIINRSGQHLLSMINDVLDLSKIEAGGVELQKNHFDLMALITETSAMIRSRSEEKGLALTVEAKKLEFPHVNTDMGKLRQILVNLLGNAVKFTDEGGVVIRCVTERIPEAPNHCHLVIEVEDTGPGIDPARQAKIFEPFVQGIDEPVRRGTGLGLSICKKYAESMGGTIEVESEAGKGSLFVLRLPAEIVVAADVKKSLGDRPRVVGLASAEKTRRILVADDKRENLLLLKSLLEGVGFVVLEAKNGQEAVAAFEKESPDFVWMDMRMPVMDGYEAVQQIRQYPGGDTVPIIAITASAFREQRQEILAAGCNDLVIKPFRAHEIFEMMGRFLDIDYIYGPGGEVAPARKAETELTSAMLADLPEDLLQELRKATLALNCDAALDVIARFAGQAPEVAAGLQHLVENFQLAELRDLLEMSGTEHV
ncbi:MAG: transporter substrate-binding domain-containing protein [Desulfobacterales bacterium]